MAVLLVVVELIPARLIHLDVDGVDLAVEDPGLGLGPEGCTRLRLPTIRDGGNGLPSGEAENQAQNGKGHDAGSRDVERGCHRTLLGRRS